MAKYKGLSVNIGMEKTYYAVMEDVEQETYGEVKFLAEGIELGITPNEESTSGYGGNKAILTESGLKDISLSITIPSLTEEQQIDIFGLTQATEGGLISSINNTKRYIALMAEKTLNDGNMEYVTLFKGKLQLSEDKSKTQEGSTEYNWVSCSGTFMPLSNGVWKFAQRTTDEGFTKVEHDKTWGKTVVKPTPKPVV